MEVKPNKWSKVDPFELSKVVEESIKLGEPIIAKPNGYGPTYGRKRIVEKERPPERQYYEEEYIPYAQPEPMQQQPQMEYARPRPRVNLCPMCDNNDTCDYQDPKVFKCSLYRKPIVSAKDVSL